MKPTKNRIFCPQGQRSKMLFATREEAIRFLRFNAKEIETETGVRPVRTYFCTACGGWHITSKPQSCDPYDLVRRFGTKEGQRLSEIVKDIKGNCISIKEGLQRKIRHLRRTLKFQIIDADRCQTIISDLIISFETVMRIRLEEPNTIKRLFEKFSKLCDIYIRKKENRPACVWNYQQNTILTLKNK